MLKQLLRKADAALLGGALSKINQQITDARALRRWRGETEVSSPYTFASHYQKNRADLFWCLCDQYGSDKAEQTSLHPTQAASHSYADFYSRLFSHCRDKIEKVFECGLGTHNSNFVSNMGTKGRPGASLRVWRDYFPRATVIGADIDRSVLFEEDRIKSFYVDQLDPAAIAAFWQTAAISDFDLMVDDGLHTFEAGSCLFEHSVAKLAPHGIYIIEDVKLADLTRYADYFANKDFTVDYVNLHRPGVALSDNNLVVIRRTQAPD